MIYVWLALFIISIVIEIMVPALVSIWFAAGSLASLLLAVFLGDSLIWLQVLVFIIVSGATIVVLRPLVFKNRNLGTKTNVESLIDKVGIVITPIKKFNPGTVKIQGLVWTAEVSQDSSEVLEENMLVQIEKVEGNKLIVKKYEEEIN